MTTLPSEESGKYADQSRDFIRQAREELERGDLAQASEKIWGAAAQAVKSVAEMRGWEHKHHALIIAAAWRIAREHNRPAIQGMMDAASLMHQNFYENLRDEEYIAEKLGQVEESLSAVEEVKNEVPQSIEPATRRQRELIGMLDGVLDLRGQPRNP